MHVSIIIATFNRAAVLRETLAAFTQLDARGLCWEVVVADNNSSDNTADVVQSFLGQLPIRYLFAPDQGKNNALNGALTVATGAILVFTDDDVTPRENWLQEAVRASAHWPNYAVFGGRIEPLFPAGAPYYLRDSSYSNYVYAIHAPQKNEGPYDNDGTPDGPNCWIRRHLFDQGWKYNEDIGPKGRGRVSGSELELFTRLRAAGYKPVYVPGAIVQHRIQRYQTTIMYLLKRAFASGRGHMRIFGAPAQSPRLFGAPRYLFRMFLGHAARAGGQLFILNFKGSFEQVMRCATVFGSIYEARSAQQTSVCI